MDLAHKLFTLLPLVMFFPALCSSQSSFTCSRATYYGSPYCYGNPRGACGFGDYGTTVNGGNVGAVARLYRKGAGCGACYQVRCTNPQLCTDNGVTVVATDYGEGDNTDFILTTGAYAKLARSNMAAELLAYGVVNIEFKRVACRYEGTNLKIKIHERSSYPHYLALTILFQSGKSDITAVDLWLEDCKEWRPMRRVFGAVFDMENPPRGVALSIRLYIDGQLTVEMNSVIPSGWEAGVAYDTNVQLY